MNGNVYGRFQIGVGQIFYLNNADLRSCYPHLSAKQVGNCGCGGTHGDILYLTNGVLFHLAEAFNNRVFAAHYLHYLNSCIYYLFL